MKKLDMYITYVCGSSCVFCCVLDKVEWFRETRTSPHMPFAEVTRILDEKAAEGYNYATLTGGEPTLHPDFPKIVRHCKKNRMRVSLNTNAVRLSDKSFCEDVIPYIDEMVISIHAHRPELHNRFTGAAYSFEKFLLAMENLHRSNRNVYLITDTVLITENLAHVGEITDFLLMFPKLKHILFSNVNIPPDKTEALRHLVPTLPQVRDVLPDIVRRLAVKPDRILRFYGIPFCMMGDYLIYSSDLYFEPKVVLDQLKRDGAMMHRESPAPRPDKAKLKTGKCDGCIYYNTCGGFFNSYYTLFKDEHIRAIRKETQPKR